MIMQGGYHLAEHFSVVSTSVNKLTGDIPFSASSSVRYTVVSEFLSPDCTLHTAITHTISAWLSLTYDYAIGIHTRPHHSNTVVTQVTAVHNWE